MQSSGNTSSQLDYLNEELKEAKRYIIATPNRSNDFKVEKVCELHSSVRDTVKFQSEFSLFYTLSLKSAAHFFSLL